MKKKIVKRTQRNYQKEYKKQLLMMSVLALTLPVTVQASDPQLEDASQSAYQEPQDTFTQTSPSSNPSLNSEDRDPSPALTLFQGEDPNPNATAAFDQIMANRSTNPNYDDSENNGKDLITPIESQASGPYGVLPDETDPVDITDSLQHDDSWQTMIDSAPQMLEDARVAKQKAIQDAAGQEEYDQVSNRPAASQKKDSHEYNYSQITGSPLGCYHILGVSENANWLTIRNKYHELEHILENRSNYGAKQKKAAARALYLAKNAYHTLVNPDFAGYVPSAQDCEEFDNLTKSSGLNLYNEDGPLWNSVGLSEPDDANVYGILDVRTDAQIEAINQAYAVMNERIQAITDAGLSDVAQNLQQAVDKAYNILTDRTWVNVKIDNNEYYDFSNRLLKAERDAEQSRIDEQDLRQWADDDALNSQDNLGSATYTIEQPSLSPEEIADLDAMGADVNMTDRQLANGVNAIANDGENPDDNEANFGFTDDYTGDANEVPDLEPALQTNRDTFSTNQTTPAADDQADDQSSVVSDNESV